MRTNERAGGHRLPAFFLVVRWIHGSIYRRVGWIGGYREPSSVWVDGVFRGLLRWQDSMYVQRFILFVCSFIPRDTESYTYLSERGKEILRR